MSIKTLVKGLMAEYQLTYEEAKKIYEQRAKRKFDRPEAFEKERILKGGNGDENQKF